MIDQIITYHKKEYGKEPTVVCSAPGKIDLLGEHGDLGQRVLSLAIDQRLYVAVSLRNDNSLRFFSANLKERKKTTITGLRYKREDRWANYPKGVIDELLRMGFKIRGVNITICSEVPMGIGLSSSSAMTIATVCALRTLFDFSLSEGQVIEAARLAETKFIGHYMSIHSPMTCYFARKNHLMLIDTRSLQVEHFPLPESFVRILVTDSRVTEQMTDEEKIEIDEQCRDCAKALGLSNPDKLFRNFTREDLSGTIEGLSERSRRISLHFITENMRIQEFCTALENGLPETLGRILFRSHESLRDQLEISCPELDWLTKRGIETKGVYGSRMIGSGYGGCTISLLNPNMEERCSEYLEEYDRIFGFKASVFSVATGEGTQVHLNSQ